MIAVIDYRMGNLFSVVKALEYVGGEVRVLEQPEELEHFGACLLPGVGNFGDGAEALHSRGWTPVLRRFIAGGRPFFGICLGMQLLLDASEEAPGAAGLGVIPGPVRRFPPAVGKVPHMGWNTVAWSDRLPVGLEALPEESYYFVHSYYACPDDPAWRLGRCNYTIDFAAALGRDRLLATQFHPEKSQQSGLRLLTAFVAAEQAS